MTREQIFTLINDERYRQNDEHPGRLTKQLLHPVFDPTKRALALCVIQEQISNDELEARGDYSAYRVLLEELHEFFSETDKKKQIVEAIQNAALWVRIVEELTSE